MRVRKLASTLLHWFCFKERANDVAHGHVCGLVPPWLSPFREECALGMSLQHRLRTARAPMPARELVMRIGAYMDGAHPSGGGNGDASATQEGR